MRRPLGPQLLPITIVGGYPHPWNLGVIGLVAILGLGGAIGCKKDGGGTTPTDEDVLEEIPENIEESPADEPSDEPEAETETAFEYPDPHFIFRSPGRTHKMGDEMFGQRTADQWFDPAKGPNEGPSAGVEFKITSLARLGTGDDGVIFAGGPAGLFRYDPEAKTFAVVHIPGIANADESGAVVDLFVAKTLAPTSLIVGFAKGVAAVDRNGGALLPFTPAPDGETIAAVAGTASAAGAMIVAALSASGVRRLYSDEQTVPAWEAADPLYDPLQGVAVRDIEMRLEGDSIQLWFATDRGGHQVEYPGQDRSPTSSALPEAILTDTDCRAVLWGTGGVYFGCAQGLARIGDGRESGGKWRGAPGSLPYEKITALADGGADADGNPRAILGHDLGATRVTFTKGAATIARVEHMASGRYIPGCGRPPRDRKGKWTEPYAGQCFVTAVTADNRVAMRQQPNFTPVFDDAFFIAGPKGLGRVWMKPMTLAQKAEFMDEHLNEFHWRAEGFVDAEKQIDDPWKPTKWTGTDNDNDGLWTQMQVGAFAFAFAVTGDEKFRQRARRAIEGMMLLVDVPGVEFAKKPELGYGFIARSYVRSDEDHLYPHMDPTRWHPVEFTNPWSGQTFTYKWKDDTSSDETTGHFFGFPLYYDLVAKDDAERAEIAHRAGGLADYIRRHGFRLLDLDGERTTWGRWEKSFVPIGLDGLDACVREWTHLYGDDVFSECASSGQGGGWLNAAEILGHMLAAWHMTKDPKFYDAYEELLASRYGECVQNVANAWTVTKWRFKNHSDHELAYLAYYTLLRYEPNPDRRALWKASMDFMYEHELPERNPLWAGIQAMAAPDGYDLPNAIRTLREIPMDLREWLSDNQHRMDAKVRPEVDRFERPQFDTVFPYDEIRTMWWNGSPYSIVDGGNERSSRSPMFWLLPYWMLRYEGAITD